MLAAATSPAAGALAGATQHRRLLTRPHVWAQALCDLEANSNDLKAELRELYIVSAKEVDVTGRKAVVIFVPFKLLKVVHKIQSRLVRELEKKFSGKHVVLIGQRRIMRKPSSGQRQPKQKRPRSRTLTAVHESILEDLVYPTEVSRHRVTRRRRPAARSSAIAHASHAGALRLPGPRAW
jgi:hypothetical protein